ncbi:MAG: hypothetical protein WBI82_02295 [Sphaerochaeta sp.]
MHPERLPSSVPVIDSSSMRLSPGLAVQVMVLDVLSCKNPLYRIEQFWEQQDRALLLGRALDAIFEAGLSWAPILSSTLGFDHALSTEAASLTSMGYDAKCAIKDTFSDTISITGSFDQAFKSSLEAYKIITSLALDKRFGPISTSAVFDVSFYDSLVDTTAVLCLWVWYTPENMNAG